MIRLREQPPQLGILQQVVARGEERGLGDGHWNPAMIARKASSGKLCNIDRVGAAHHRQAET
jgi:hypothetical protein